MKNKGLALVASAILLCPIGSVAQNNDSDKKQMVEVAAGVKIYYPAKMGFSLNEPLENVINMITMYNQHSDFTLMVNGENYLQSRESFLAHTLVADVERIEIITDPSICGNNIGTDGNITRTCHIRLTEEIISKVRWRKGCMIYITTTTM